jgi:thiol-disulfide isomerase/thioredoxin
MVLTPSKMIELGTYIPNFNLPDTTKEMKMTSVDDVICDNGLVVMFICNHCPFVKHVNPELVRIASDYMAKGIGFIGISSNDAEEYGEDSPENMTDVASELRYPFSYLYDESQEVAKEFNASCTPDFFVYDKEGKLVYRGQLDDSRPGNGLVLNGKSMREALDAMLEGRRVEGQKPSVGCNIKWRG